MDNEALLKNAQQGDIKAFHALFSTFQPSLKSYLYRLVANRNEMEDLVHDTFIQAFDHIRSFNGDSGLKTWVFTIATRLALQYLRKQKRWHKDTLVRTRDLAHQEDTVMALIMNTNRYDPYGVFEIREHIDYCFTCTTHMLPIEQQLVLILKDIYAFKVKEIAAIMHTTYGRIKHLLHDARKTMIHIFDDQCALVSKRGVCDQCSQLNGRFNPKQDTQAALMRLHLVRDASDKNKKELYNLRAELVKAIDPIESSGATLHDVFLSINNRVNT